MRRGRQPAGAEVPIAAPIPFIKLSISLSDGSFETYVKVPLDCTEADRNKAIQRWLSLAGHAMQQGVEELHATLERIDAPHP